MSVFEVLPAVFVVRWGDVWRSDASRRGLKAAGYTYA